jgi:hypothetical protein
MAAVQSAGIGGTTAADWTCGCGQRYRVAVTGERRTFWPRNSAIGFSTHALGCDATCVRCGKPLDGAAHMR